MNTCATCKHLGPPIVERCEWDEGHDRLQHQSDTQLGPRLAAAMLPTN